MYETVSKTSGDGIGTFRHWQGLSLGTHATRDRGRERPCLFSFLTLSPTQEMKQKVHARTIYGRNRGTNGEKLISVAFCHGRDPHCFQGKPVGKRPLKRGITGSLRNGVLVMIVAKVLRWDRGPDWFSPVSHRAIEGRREWALDWTRCRWVLDVRTSPWADTSSKWIGPTEGLTDVGFR